jgi:hypothetical protein
LAGRQNQCRKAPKKQCDGSSLFHRRIVQYFGEKYQRKCGKCGNSLVRPSDFTEPEFPAILIYNKGEKVMPATKTTAKKITGKPVPKKTKKVTIDDVWATIDRIGKAHAEFEKALKETQQAHKETEQAIKETQQAHRETVKTLQETHLAHQETEKTLNKAIGGLSNTLGSLIEHIMIPGLPRKFRQFGFSFDRITTVKWADGKGNIYTEIDGLLENGSQAMVVEVKTTLRRDDIDDHLERMDRVRKYADDHGDKRDFLGAMAATIIDKDTKEYTLSKGFFVIEPSGEDVKITKPVSKPKVW